MAVDIDKLEPAELNHLARELLLNEMNQRMTLLNTIINFELNLGRERFELARNSILSEDLCQVEDYVLEAAELLKTASESLRFDAGRLVDLAGEVKRIRQSEEV